MAYNNPTGPNTTDVDPGRSNPVPTTDTFFKDGDGCGTNGTRVDADWLNGVTKVLKHLYQFADIDPSKQAVDSPEILFEAIKHMMYPYESPVITGWSAGVPVIVNHNLGDVPKHVFLEAICTNAVAGYAVNDVVQLAGVMSDPDGNQEGYTITKDTIRIHVQIGINGLGILTRRDTAGPLIMNSATWDFRIRASL